MISRIGVCLFLALAVTASTARAQEKLGPPRAAMVNGEPILEAAVQRALKGVPQEHLAAARKEILDHLIDHLLIEQHLIKLKVEITKAEVESRYQEVQKEIKEQGQDFAKVLTELNLSEAELKLQIAADLRWDHYVQRTANDQSLAALFKSNKDWFDGSQVRARHILIEAGSADPKAVEAARQKLVGIRKQIETKVAQEMAKVDPKADNLVREQTRQKALNDAFSAWAASSSSCPSKENGGDLGSFFRIGSMVEPFARAAFALQPGQLSEIVETQFGVHLILVTARLPGKDVKFDDLKDEVREIHAERLRDELLPQLRKAAKIEMTAVKPSP